MHDEAAGASAEDVAKIAAEVTRDFDGTCRLLANELAVSRDPALLLDVVRRIASQSQGDNDEEQDDDDKETAAAAMGRTHRWLSDELLERFETDFLPQVVQLVLARQFDADCVMAATAFLQFVMVTAKHKLLSGDPCLLPSLARILDDQRPFYERSSGSTAASERTVEDAGNKPTERSASQRRADSYRFAVERSPYVTKRYLVNLQFWGDIGGFSLFLTALRSTMRDEDGELDTVLSIEAIQCVFRTVYSVKDHVANAFLLEFFPAFCASARTFMGALASSEFQALSRESLAEVSQVMELLLDRVLLVLERTECDDADTTAEVDNDSGHVNVELLVQSVQLLRLEVLVRQFRSSSLEKRIHGLSEIVSLCTREFNDQVERQLRPTAASLVEKLEYLVVWLSKYEVMEELFGEKLHSELIKRSVPLFQFASELECLQPQWLDLVWRCYRGVSSDDDGQQSHQRHEAHRTAVQDVLLEVVACLDAPLLERLFRKVQGVAAVDSGALKLLAAIAARGSRTLDRTDASASDAPSRSLRDQVLTYLWEVAVPSIDSEPVMDQVLEQIEEIAKRGAFCGADASSDGESTASPAERSLRAAPPLIDSFVGACIVNVSGCQLVMASLKLFTRLILLATEARWLLPSLDAVGDTSVASVLLTELLDSKTASVGGELSLGEIKVRLLALRVAWIAETTASTGSSTPALRQSQLAVVWRLLVEYPSAPDEPSLCFHWIEFCLNTCVVRATTTDSVSAASTLFSTELIETFLIPKFGSLPDERISLSTQCCLHALFRHLNLALGGLEAYVTETGDDDESTSADDNERSTDLVTGKPLVGLEQLWHLAIKASDSDVAEDCITLLASYYLEFVPSMRGTEFAVQKQLEFVETCMDYLSPAASTHADGELKCREAVDRDSVAAVNRCVDMLLYFLEACDALAAARSRRSTRRPSNASDPGSSEGQGVDSHGFSLSQSKLSGRTFELESLEDRLQHLEIYPSPMKEVHVAGAGPRDAFAASRRPSWTFQHQHTLLDAILDEESNDDSDGSGDILQSTSTSLQVVDGGRSRERGLSVELSNPETFGEGDAAVSSKVTVRSPTLRVRPVLHWQADVPPSRGPDLSLEDLSKALQDASTERAGEGSLGATLSETRAEVDGPAGTRKSTHSAPSRLLANDATYFDTLFSLVSWSDSTSQRAWELICRLPTNNEQLRKMIRLRPSGSAVVPESVAWMTQFDMTNVHRLLYAMRLVEALLLPITTTEAVAADLSSESARRQWRERFVRLGGAHHLFETLVNWESLQFGMDDAASAYVRNLSATCLAAVVRTMRYFVQLYLSGSSTKWKAQDSCAFDCRLFSTTLPTFVRSVRLDKLGASAVGLSQALATSDPSLSSSRQRLSLSTQVEEAIQCAVELFAATMRVDATTASEIFSDLRDIDATSGSPSSESPPSRSTEWVVMLLLECSSHAVRSTTLRVLVELTTNSSLRGSMEAFVSHLVRGLSGMVARDCGAYDREHLDAFFDSLLSASVRSLDEPRRQVLVAWLSETRLPELLAVRLYRYTAEAADDRVVSGLLQILTSLVHLSEPLRASTLSCWVGDGSSDHEQPESGSRMAAFVLKQLIFGDLRTVPACKSERSRESAQNLLLALVSLPRDASLSNATVVATISAVGLALKALGGFQTTVLEELRARERPWNFVPRELLQDASSGLERAGLVNPGCVCYMNALVQQLFMNATFRDGLLSVDRGSAASGDSQQWSDEVAQLQRLFVSLAFTRFKSTDPTDFALSHQDMDGNPTDLRVQMDADEFFCVLLDRIDTCLRDGDAAAPGSLSDAGDADSSRAAATTFLDQCFGGVLVNQIITQQGHVSEREEKFFALSLEVSKKTHLRESLELYVQGESLEGENAYYCERLQQKVCATKRICVKTLPQTLVCHLKRFEFDFDTMEKLKINDYLEFPQELDMFPFTSAALAQPSATTTQATETESSMYDLVGIVVHSGTSDMGHYYSFIKDRSHAQPRWLEFNDEVVRKFDSSMMDAECFGGEETKVHWLSGSHVSSVQMKRRNAYMLMYERRRADGEETPPTPRSGQGAASTTASLSFASPTTRALIKKTLLENAQFQSVVDAFGANYCVFLDSVVSQALGLPREPSATTKVTDSATVESLSRWTGAVEDLSSGYAELQACVLGCQYLFGVTTLQPTASSDSRLLQSQQQLLNRIVAWLTSSGPETSSDDCETSALSTWLLRSVVSTTPSGSGSAVRSWMFDLLFLSENRPDLVAGCSEALVAAVTILMRQLASDDAGDSSSQRSRAVLTDFYRALLEMFYDREQTVELVDPISGGAAVIPPSAVIGALSRLGALLEKCVCATFVDSPDERRTTLRIVAHDLLFIDRLLFTLQAELKDPSTTLSVGPEWVPPVASAFLRVRTCTLETEQRIVSEVLAFLCRDSPAEAHAEQHLTRACRIPVDGNLVLNQTALTNIVQLGLHHALAPVLVQIALESGAAQRDKLLTLLMTILEDVKTTHLEHTLSLFCSLLDAEEAAVAYAEQEVTGADTAPVHCHIFSVSKGILEAAAYYRDHEALQGYSLQLLQFTFARAHASPLLRRLFASVDGMHEQVPWMVDWTVNHLDPSGAVRRGTSCPNCTDAFAHTERLADDRLDGICTLFHSIEDAFGCRVFPGGLVDGTEEERMMAHDSSVRRHESGARQDNEVDAARPLCLDEIVPEFDVKEEVPSVKRQWVSKSVEHGPEMDESDEEDTNNVAGGPVDLKTRTFTSRGTRSTARAAAAREMMMYNNRSEA